MLQNQDPEIQAKLMAMQRQMASSQDRTTTEPGKSAAPTPQQLQAKQFQQSITSTSKGKDSKTDRYIW